ncbi:class I SAM-dependent methyltransferase [Flavobacterium sp.]|uniref:THUMP-like domain-containing protein n=1 Tax=Flavobacterium sp. TaxID=239 RepID=UPI00352831FD
MEITALLKKDIQNFIDANLKVDIKKLALQKNPFPEISYQAILNQIVAKNKAKNKLPTWFSSKNIYYPSKISVEQTSSEKTAQYKATLVSGKTLLDASGGFGVDDYYFAKKFDAVIHCELNTELSSIVAYNFKQLKTKNITCVTGNSTNILKNISQAIDCIYIDPSRRNEKKGKVFMLTDCEPNVPELLPFYFNYTNTLLVKTAPILDIKAALLELQFVSKIHIVAVENEVKELLWLIEKEYLGNIKLIATNIEKEATESCEFNLKSNDVATFSKPLKYLYEPNAALLKSGKFNEISTLFKVHKLHQHSHLYTATNIVPFQGRKFKINTNILFTKESIKKYIVGQKMNVATRNFPLKPEELKKKYKITDGGTVFAFFTTNSTNEKIVLLCEKI